MVTETQEQGPFTVTLDQETGNITVDVDVSRDVGFLGGTVEVRLSPAGLGQLQNAVTNRIASVGGIQAQIIQSRISGELPSTDDLTIVERFDLPTERQLTQGQGIRTFTLSQQLNTLTIPVPQGVNIDEIVPDRIKPELEVVVREAGGIETTLRNIFGPGGSTFTIQPSTLIQTTGLQLTCGGRFPDITSTLNELRQNINPALETMRERSQIVEGAVNQIANNVDVEVERPTIIEGPSPGETVDIEPPEIDTDPRDIEVPEIPEQPESPTLVEGGFIPDGGERPLQQITIQNVQEAIRQGSGDVLSDARSELESIPSGLPSGVPSINSLRLDLDDVERRINRLPDAAQNCIEQFRSQLRDLRSNFEQLRSLVQGVNSMRSRGLDLLQGVDFEEIEPPEPPEPQDLECIQQVSTNLNNRINGYESDVSSIARNPRGRGRRVQELEEEAEDIIFSIRGADIDSDCVSRLTSRVRNSQSRLDGLVTLVQCDQEHPDLDRAITEYQDAIVTTSAAPPDQISEITNTGEELLNRIRNEVENNRCRREFSRRVRESTLSLRELQQRVNITIGEARERVAEREERLTELQEQLNQFLGEADFGGQFEQFEELDQET